MTESPRQGDWFAIPPSCRTPPGWEGDPPPQEIRTLDQLQKYLEWRILRLREFGDRPYGNLSQAVHPDFTNRYLILGREALRNALRVLDDLGVNERPNQWPLDCDGISHHEVEFKLSELIRWLRANPGLEKPTPSVASLNGPLLGTTQPPPDKQRAAKKPDLESPSWITVTVAAKISGIDKGIISRAVDSKKLKGKGKGRNRRICPADFTRWQAERAERPEQLESEESIRKKLRNSSD